jgi:hypothetical protein
MNPFKMSLAMAAASVVASLAVGVASAQAAKPTPTTAPVVQPCTITSKIVTLGHDRWQVNARLYRAGKRYPRHALTLVTTAADGTTVLATSPNRGTKKGKWNWRITGLIVAGETVKVTYAGDAGTSACEGVVLTPVARPKAEPEPEPTPTSEPTETPAA